MISYARLNFFCAECGRDKGKSEFECLLWTFPYHFTSEAIPGTMGGEVSTGSPCAGSE